jgi:hypothetical protein
MGEQHCRKVMNMEKVLSGEFKQTYLYPPCCCRKMMKRQGCFDDRDISLQCVAYESAVAFLFPQDPAFS